MNRTTRRRFLHLAGMGAAAAILSGPVTAWPDPAFAAARAGRDGEDGTNAHGHPALGPGLDPDVTQPGFVQGTAFNTSVRVGSTTVSLEAVGAGDLLVGWFGQYDAAGQVQVSDDANGPWTRSPGSPAFQNDTGDIVLYYVANSGAAPGVLTVTVTASAKAYF